MKIGVPGSCGRLARGIIANLKVVEADGALADVGESGEQLIQGLQVVAGWYRNPKTTEEAFADVWLRTGDEVNLKFNADGNILIVDRIKGLQVALSELEGYLLSNPDVADAVVISVLDEYSGELSRAYVVLKPAIVDAVKDERVASQVKAELYETVAPFKATAKYKQLEGGIEFLDAIPKNPSGKILRRVLREYSWQSDRQARAWL